MYFQANEPPWKTKILTLIHDVFFFFSHHLSSMIFGTNALITKPAISLAPMIVTYLLGTTNKNFSQINKLSIVERRWLGQAMFQISCFVPFFVGAIQLFTWSFYTNRRTHNTESN